MRRLIMFISLFIAVIWVPSLQPELRADGEINLRTGIGLNQGIIYNRTLDTVYNGSSLSVSVFFTDGGLGFGVGTEAGYSFTGLNLLFPLQVEAMIAGSDVITVGARAALMPGLIMTRPAPYFLIAAEAGAQLAWRVNENFDLSISICPRYTYSPDYSTQVAPLELLDLNIGICAGFIFPG